MITACMQTVHSQDDTADVDMIDPGVALAHLTAADLAETAAGQVRRQAVRDAHAAGAPVTEIAATLGIKNRVGLYQMIDEHPNPAGTPAPTPAVFVRGAGVDSGTWTAVTSALHGRGWVVVRDRTQAWHLARGRVPVVLVDISQQRPTVGRVKARYNDAQEPELPLTGVHTVVDHADPDRIALAVIEHLQDPRGRPAAATPPAPSAARTLEGEGPTKKRSIVVPDQLWEQAKNAVASVQASTLQALVADALIQTVAAIELEHHAGRPLPAVERLPTGPRTRRAVTTPAAPRQIVLPESIWARARAVVAAGYVASLPALLSQALQQKLG